MCLLCIKNALPAAIFFTSSNSWRVFWDLALADLAFSIATASSDARVFESSSKLSCFFMRAWSSCRTLPTSASYFSRSVRYVVALFSASTSACLRVATSDVAPTIAALILSLFAIAPFTYFNKVFLTFLLLELLLG